MNTGIMSSCPAYTSMAESAYSASLVAPIESEQKNPAASKPQKQDDIKDEAIISPEAQALFEADKKKASKAESTAAEEKTNESAEEANKEALSEAEKALTQEEKQVVADLKARDAEVKAHEQAHRAAAAGIRASAPSYEYETGPDGQRYAVGGEVSISFVKSSNSEENLQNARTMKSAALAPANPSPQDRAVARSADQLIMQAQQEIVQEKKVEMQEKEAEKATPLSGTQSEQTEVEERNNNEVELEATQPV